MVSKVTKKPNQDYEDTKTKKTDSSRKSSSSFSEQLRTKQEQTNAVSQNQREETTLEIQDLTEEQKQYFRETYDLKHMNNETYAKFRQDLVDMGFLTSDESKLAIALKMMPMSDPVYTVEPRKQMVYNQCTTSGVLQEKPMSLYSSSYILSAYPDFFSPLGGVNGDLVEHLMNQISDSQKRASWLQVGNGVMDGDFRQECVEFDQKKLEVLQKIAGLCKAM